MTANLFAMLILSRRRCSSRRSRLGQHRGVPARMRTSLRSLLVRYEGRSLRSGSGQNSSASLRRGTGWWLAVIPIGGYVRFVGDRKAASAPRRCIGAGRPEREAKRLLQRNRCRRRPRSVDAGPAANFPAAFSTSPASRVSGVVPGRAAEASGLMPRDLTRSKNVITFVSLGPAQAIAINIGRGGATSLNQFAAA